RQPYRLTLPPDTWHVAKPAATDDPALDLALSAPRRQARVEVRTLHAPGAGGFDLAKLEETLAKGRSHDAEDLAPGAFDRARIFRLGEGEAGAPAWVGIFMRGDRAFVVSAEAVPKNFAALSPMLRNVVRSFDYDPPLLAVPPREVVDHVRRATV